MHIKHIITRSWVGTQIKKYNSTILILSKHINQWYESW